MSFLLRGVLPKCVRVAVSIFRIPFGKGLTAFISYFLLRTFQTQQRQGNNVKPHRSLWALAVTRIILSFDPLSAFSNFYIDFPDLFLLQYFVLFSLICLELLISISLSQIIT